MGLGGLVSGLRGGGFGFARGGFMRYDFGGRCGAEWVRGLAGWVLGVGGLCWDIGVWVWRLVVYFGFGRPVFLACAGWCWVWA